MRLCGGGLRRPDLVFLKHRVVVGGFAVWEDPSGACGSQKEVETLEARGQAVETVW